MAGAYRCPVCGIDFPSGTPGAPDRSGSTAGVAPGREPEPAETAPHDDIIDAEFEHEDTLDFAPGADRAAPAGGVRTATADLNVRPREDAGRAGGAAATLSVRPARESAAVTVTDVEFEVEEDEEPPRRGWGRALFGTLVSAVVLIAVVAGSVWWLDSRGALPSGSMGAFTVETGDGWVSLPTEGRALVVEADGPFRLRVSGRVYSLPGDRAVQIPADAEASVRIVRSPTTATVSAR